MPAHGHAARTPRVEGSPITAGTETRAVTRGRLRALLADYAVPGHTPDPDAGSLAGLLRVPDDHLPILTAQAAQLSGALAPRQPQARREFLAELYVRASQGSPVTA
jgi:hypothetical protein